MFFHLHLLTDASINLATTMGGSVCMLTDLPASVVRFAASCIVHPTLSKVQIRAAAGPVTTRHGCGDSPVLIVA